jgi:hypothetical protein
MALPPSESNRRRETLMRRTQMQDQDLQLIDQLIDTYHQLNVHVRNAPEATLRGRDASGTSIEDIVRRMRDDELRFAQALRERTTGVAMPDIFGGDEQPVIGTETANESTAELISDFGTAREVTLSLLRDLADVTWDQGGDGAKTVRSSVSDLVASDQRRLAQIAAMLGSASPAATA